MCTVIYFPDNPYKIHKSDWTHGKMKHILSFQRYKSAMLSCTFNSIYYFILVLSKHTKMMLSTLILYPQQSANLYIFCHTPPLLTLSACHKHIFTPFMNLFSSGNALTHTRILCRGLWIKQKKSNNCIYVSCITTRRRESILICTRNYLNIT